MSVSRGRGGGLSGLTNIKKNFFATSLRRLHVRVICCCEKRNFVKNSTYEWILNIKYKGFNSVKVSELTALSSLYSVIMAFRDDDNILDQIHP